jgi:pSer/pThr/pTyr-binding forkhead associated (FHA) protein
MPTLRIAMRLEITHPGGPPHEVDLPGTVAVLGRDPSCDLVLNDTKCSRRHAVLEEGPDGLAIRDSGSANGVHVNGKRVARARLRPGDTIRLGDVRILVLAPVGETVVMAPDDLVLEELGPGGDQPKTSPPRPAPAEPRTRPRAGARDRPLTVRLLALLWLVAAVALAAGGLLAASRSGSWGGWAFAAGAAGLALAAGCVALALGLRALAPWARTAQIVTAGLGLLVCPFTLASATVLLYMLRPETSAAFAPGSAPAAGGAAARSAEGTFALSLLGMLVLGGILTAALLLMLLRPGR